VKAFLVMVFAAALVAAAGGSAAPARSSGTGAKTCPAAWRPGWQKLANQVGAPVYCPSWMPNPLDGNINGSWKNGYSVKRDGTYFVSFLSHDLGDIHVNFRGYPGRTTIPKCTTVQTEGGKTVRGSTPCFADPSGTYSVNGIKATLYTVNQDADQWHLLYAWRHNGSLYSLSQHVIKPMTYARVIQNLHRLLGGLVLVRPHGG
jgi:hypothetical protein